MKINRWPFWPVFAMTSLIAIVIVVEVKEETAGHRCVVDVSACSEPTVTFNKLFVP